MRVKELFRVFIDGSAGTTGLRIRERLAAREDVELIELAEAERKDVSKRKWALNACDAAILCLPDAAAREAVSMVENERTVVLDASTAHRTAPGWAYGFPELGKKALDAILASRRVAVPGCHASGFIALVAPLIREGLLAPETPLSCTSLTGYSGGGKKMIADYREQGAAYDPPRPYGLAQAHKHLPEMTKVCGLAAPPVFLPIVGNFYSGMLVSVPLHRAQLLRGAGMEDVRAVYKNYYAGPVVTYRETLSEDGFASAGLLSGTDSMRIACEGNEERFTLLAAYDNLVKGAPLMVTKANIADGCASAILCNSGNANTCNADGEEVAQKMCALAADALGIPARDVVVASTGVIGQRLDISPIAAGMEALVSGLSADALPAAEAILTTDTKVKSAAVEFSLGGKTAHLGGIAKGSGMIHPNMATMLVFVTTDAAIAPPMLQKALSADVQTSFNRISVDGDTSTNDMCCVLANGMAGNAEITAEGEDHAAFCAALNAVTTALCRMIARDGEGATKLVECALTGAKTQAAADAVSKAVICSSLVKAAMFGSDANWGRVLCAIGYAGADVDVNKVDVYFRSAAGRVSVCKSGAGVDFSEDEAKKVLLEDEVTIEVDLNDGNFSSVAWGCDLTYDYVKINGDYRT